MQTRFSRVQPAITWLCARTLLRPAPHHPIPHTPHPPPAKLAVSQGNALVYSTLCAFMLVGLFAGYRTQNATQFLSGLRTQSGEWRAPAPAGGTG